MSRFFLNTTDVSKSVSYLDTSIDGEIYDMLFRTEEVVFLTNNIFEKIFWHQEHRRVEDLGDRWCKRLGEHLAEILDLCKFSDFDIALCHTLFLYQ